MSLENQMSIDTPLKQGFQWDQLSYNPSFSVSRKLLKFLSFQLIQYQEPVPILKNVYGNVQLGRLVAIMGPSGCGKTSLMKCLSQGLLSITGASGSIWSYGISERIRASIIHQDEELHLTSDLTVFESLVYASQLKNHFSLCGQSFHEENVNGILKRLGLMRVANNFVRKCSGGERKRLAIGLELTEVQKPHILFLDEPTTGLDSRVAHNMVKILHDLAKTNHMAIVATIHQPSIEILNIFDTAIILSGNGDVLYHDNPSVFQLMDFLKRSVPHYSLTESVLNIINTFANPVDVIVALASVIAETGTENENKFESVNEMENDESQVSCYSKFLNIFNTQCKSISIAHTADQNIYNNEMGTFRTNYPVPSSPESICQAMMKLTKLRYHNDVKNMTTLKKDQNSNESSTVPLTNKKNYSAKGLVSRTNSQQLIGFASFKGFIPLLQRTWKLRIVRGKCSLFLRLCMYLVVVGATTLFYDRGIGTDSGCVNLTGNGTQVQNMSSSRCFEKIEEIRGESAVSANIKLMFFLLLFLCLESLLNMALSLPGDFELFLREFQNGWYSVPAYFCSKILVELPAQILIPSIYATYFYLYTNQENFGISWNLDILGLNVTTDTPGYFGFGPGERFKLFLRVIYLSGFISQALGFLIGILCVNSIRKTILMSSGTLLSLSFFCGFFKKRAGMPEWQLTLTTFSFLRYSLDTLIIIIYGRDRCQLSGEYSFPMLAYGINDEDLKNNWMDILRLLVLTWGLAFMLLELKASNWIILKKIRQYFLKIAIGRQNRDHGENKDRFCTFKGASCKILKILEKIRHVLWRIFKWLTICSKYAVIIILVFPVTVYFFVGIFIGGWY